MSAPMYLDDDIHPWLTVMLGAKAAAAYAAVPNVMLFEMLPALRYGPHGDELLVLFEKINVIFQSGARLPLTHTYSTSNFLARLGNVYHPFHAASYTNHRLYFGVGREAPYIDRLAEGDIERHDARRPMVRLRLNDLLPAAPRQFNPWHMSSLNVIINTVLLQHWYADRVTTHGELQQLIPAHNRFCAAFGLPLLSRLPQLR